MFFHELLPDRQDKFVFYFSKGGKRMIFVNGLTQYHDYETVQNLSISHEYSV